MEKSNSTSIIYKYLGDTIDIPDEQAADQAESIQLVRESDEIAQVLAMIDEVNQEERHYFTVA